MKISNIKSVEHRFTELEYQAISCVLPLIGHRQPFSPQLRKAQLDAIAKINRRSASLQGHELNAVISAVELSIQLLSGKQPELMQIVRQDTQWLEEMRNHFFVLNKLRQEFHQLTTEFE